MKANKQPKKKFGDLVKERQTAIANCQRAWKLAHIDELECKEKKFNLENTIEHLRTCTDRQLMDILSGAHQDAEQKQAEGEKQDEIPVGEEAASS